MQRIAIVLPLTLNELNDGTMDCNDRCCTGHDWACHIANRLRQMMSRRSAVALDGNPDNRRMKLDRSDSKQENGSGKQFVCSWRSAPMADPASHWILKT